MLELCLPACTASHMHSWHSLTHAQLAQPHACTAATASHMHSWHSLTHGQVAQPHTWTGGTTSGINRWHSLRHATCCRQKDRKKGGRGRGKRDTMPLGVTTGASVPRSSPSHLLQTLCTDLTYSLDKLATILLVAQCWLPHTNSSQDTRTATPFLLHCCCRTLAKILSQVTWLLRICRSFGYLYGQNCS